MSLRRVPRWVSAHGPRTADFRIRGAPTTPSVRDFLGNPGLASGASSGRTDRVRSGTATISYRPARTLTLLMSAQREGRSSNVVPADATATTPAVLPVDYVVNVISIAARITF